MVKLVAANKGAENPPSAWMLAGYPRGIGGFQSLVPGDGFLRFIDHGSR